MRAVTTVRGFIIVALAAAMALLGTEPPSASAAPLPMQDAPSATAITADALPTVQIDGVAWSQAIVGNTVYVGGRFNNARPAGAAPGTNLTPRGNLLAYDIRTGNLITSFAPSLNGQVLSVAASPDGTRIYVAGDFTTANGQSRRRVAAYSTATGQLITSFNPVGVNSQARAIVATNDTVYVGGGFLGAGGTARANLAAFSASTGALLPWDPQASRTVWSLATDPTGSAVFAAGQFETVGGQPAYGMAKISAASGALDTSWAATQTVRNAGADAAVGHIHYQNGYVYGTTWHFGPGGNLEGNFKAAADTGVVQWVTDCHGDNYGNWVSNGIVYSVGHAHYCGNMGDGFPQYPAWKFQHSQAWNDTQTGDILTDAHGYPNWAGVKPGPAMVAWNPTMAIGSFTGQYQAGWHIVGNGDYVAVGGEFPRVNGTGQQGLVRFARRGIAPAKQGPIFPTGSATPTVLAVSPTSVRVTWPAAYDRDGLALTYRVYRGSTLIHTTSAASSWWNLPALGTVDRGLNSGSSYSYRITATDADGNVVNGASRSITLPASVVTPTAYANSVTAAGARIYWPLNEPSGLTATDRATTATSGAGIGINDGVAGTGVDWGLPGIVGNDTSAYLTGNLNGDYSKIYSSGIENAPNEFTAQIWFQTSTTSGGRLLGFGDLQDGNSGHRDRHIYMNNAGQLTFGVQAPDGSKRTITSGASYNDGGWHMVTATMGPQGMVLYVDGVRVGRRIDTTVGDPYLGSWRVGGDNLDGWPSAGSSRNFLGGVDDVAIYPTALTHDQVIGQYAASGRTAAVPTAPADAYGAAVYADDPDLYWRLGESSGTVAQDSGRGGSTGAYFGGVTLGQPGIVPVDSAAQFDGSSAFVGSNATASNPTIYSTEAWFSTTTNRGGKIIGFGGTRDGLSGSYDRHVYMQDDGRLVFGVWTGQMNVITTTAAYNDGQYHHVVATQSGDGMKLYVDGILVGTNPQTAAQDYSGYWKVGGDTTWGSSSPYLAGTIDEVAVYSYALSAERVTAHYLAGGGQPNLEPTAAFTAASDQKRATFDASASADQDGTIVSYAWDFGDGQTGTGVTTQHVYAAAGTYTVTLTVTDNKGSTGTVAHQVAITAPPAPADAYGATVFADGPIAYWRMDETAGSTLTDVSGAGTHGTLFGGYTLGAPGALADGGTAIAFNGSNGMGSTNMSFDHPNSYAIEAFFQTTSTQGGKIIGFGNNRTGQSSSYDRHVYMEDNGRLVFGTYTGQLNTITSDASYNDGEWHHLVAMQSADGMKLYVDGVLVGTNPQTQAEGYTGYWKIGGDTTWGSSSAYLNGSIDEVAIYNHPLTADRVAAHAAAAQPDANQPPTAALTATATNLTVTVDGSGSTDPDGTVASYAWNFGDGSTGTGATATHTYAAAGTYTVTLTVTDNEGATATASQSVTATAPPANQAPTAAFTATATQLSVAVDGTASSDPDGSVASYAWNFGDGSTGTGATATHTYAAAGTYTVTLTVTDNQGATATVSQSVTATAPPVNQAPTAAFTVSGSGLTVAVNGTGSSDPDGTIASYAWNWGDGTTGIAATANHTYAAAGTYTVTLTVTDNQGATASTSKSVTVTAPPAQTVFAQDLFDRTLTGQWGTADVGGPWTIPFGAAAFGVSGGQGLINVPRGSGYYAWLNQTTVADVDLTMNVGYAQAGSGGGIFTSLIARRIGNSDYRVKLQVTAVGTAIHLTRFTNGTETALASQQVAGLVYAPGDVLTLRLQVSGTGTTTLKAKVWKAGTPEPATWLSTTDTTAALQGPGVVGTYTYVSGSSATTPIGVRVNDFTAAPIV